MEIKEITVTVGKTVNVGNFNSIRADISMTASVELERGTDEAEQAVAGLRSTAMEELAISINELT
jgi:hypothetical protein